MLRVRVSRVYQSQQNWLALAGKKLLMEIHPYSLSF